MFGFHKIAENLDITLTSYVPKIGKAVILVSTLHDKPEIDPSSDAHKPKMITFYNEDKCGVDCVDQLCANYDCRRRTKRWPNIVMFNLINICGINAFVQFYDEKDKQKKDARYDFLQKVAFELILPLVEKRLNFSQVPVDTRKKCANLLKKPFSGKTPNANLSELNRMGPTDKSQGSCELCKPKFKNSRNCCSKCQNFVCPNHFYKICDDCIPK